MKSGKRGIATTFYIDTALMEPFQEISWRERKSKSEIINDILERFILTHKEGNDTSKLDHWTINPRFLALPEIMSTKEEWHSYIKKEDPIKLMKINKQIVFILNQINESKRLNNQKEKNDLMSAKEIEDQKLARQRVNDRIRRESDIRNRDPKNMKPHELWRYNEIKQREEENRVKTNTKIVKSPDT